MNLRTVAKALGRKGGRARARRLSAEQRKRIASLGGKARARSLEAAKRIVVNFRYANTIQILRGNPPPVKRLKTFRGPLPGLYA